jgi:hypothetical protein
MATRPLSRLSSRNKSETLAPGFALRFSPFTEIVIAVPKDLSLAKIHSSKHSFPRRFILLRELSAWHAIEIVNARAPCHYWLR